LHTASLPFIVSAGHINILWLTVAPLLWVIDAHRTKEMGKWNLPNAMLIIFGFAAFLSINKQYFSVTMCCAHGFVGQNLCPNLMINQITIPILLFTFNY
jgi:hypothetical protein